MLGCAPIPGGQAPAQEPPKPNGRWHSRFGAIAEDASAGERGVVLSTGVAEAQSSSGEASSLAIKNCEQNGGLRCKVVTSYTDSCIALADPIPRPRPPSMKSVSAGGRTKALAIDAARKGCSPQDGGKSCNIAYAACSLPLFEALR